MAITCYYKDFYRFFLLFCEVTDPILDAFNRLAIISKYITDYYSKFNNDGKNKNYLNNFIILNKFY